MSSTEKFGNELRDVASLSGNGGRNGLISSAFNHAMHLGGGDKLSKKIEDKKYLRDFRKWMDHYWSGEAPPASLLSQSGNVAGGLGLAQVGINRGVLRDVRYGTKVPNLGKLGFGFGKLGYVGAGLNTISDFSAYNSRGIGLYRLGFSLTGTALSFYAESAVGGLPGLIAGTAVATIWSGEEYLHGNYNKLAMEYISREIIQFQNAIKNVEYYPGKF